MPGWINTNIKTETRARLDKYRNGKSCDIYITELLDFWEAHQTSPDKLDELLNRVAILEDENEKLKSKKV